MATKKAAPRKKRRRVTVSVGKTRRRRRSHVGAKQHGRKRRHSINGTAQDYTKQILPLAVGMGIGVGVQNFVLRPIEARIAQQSPMLAKMMGAAEIIIGGFVFVKGKSAVVKGIGAGIMAGGVNTVSRQLNIYHESPAITGGDYGSMVMPISGANLDRTQLIAGMSDEEYLPPRMGSFANTDRTALVAGYYGM